MIFFKHELIDNEGCFYNTNVVFKFSCFVLLIIVAIYNYFVLVRSCSTLFGNLNNVIFQHIAAVHTVMRCIVCLSFRTFFYFTLFLNVLCKRYLIYYIIISSFESKAVSLAHILSQTSLFVIYIFNCDET